MVLQVEGRYYLWHRAWWDGHVLKDRVTTLPAALALPHADLTGPTDRAGSREPETYATVDSNELQALSAE